MRSSPTPAEIEAALDRASRVARATDLRWLDPILGFLLPGLGDAFGAVIGLYIVGVAWQLRAPKTLIARMFINLAVDAALGLIPFVGDLADLVNRANLRNVELLRRRSQTGALRSGPADWLVLLVAFLLFAATLALPIVLVVAGVRALGG